jgi:hypothetical protein
MISRGGSGGFARRGRRVLTQRHDDAPRSWLELVDRSAQRLGALGISAPVPFDLDTFSRQLVQLRGRPIVLTPISVRANSATVCGYCLALADRDHVFYARSRSPLHSMHNAVHELAHLALGHTSVAPLAFPDGALDRPVLPGPALDDPATSADYSIRCEDEADAAAAVLLGSWQRPAPRSWVRHSTLGRGPARLADAFG